MNALEIVLQDLGVISWSVAYPNAGTVKETVILDLPCKVKGVEPRTCELIHD